MPEKSNQARDFDLTNSKVYLPLFIDQTVVFIFEMSEPQVRVTFDFELQHFGKFLSWEIGVDQERPVYSSVLQVDCCWFLRQKKRFWNKKDKECYKRNALVHIKLLLASNKSVRSLISWSLNFFIFPNSYFSCFQKKFLGIGKSWFFNKPQIQYSWPNLSLVDCSRQ